MFIIKIYKLYRTLVVDYLKFGPVYFLLPKYNKTLYLIIYKDYQLASCIYFMREPHISAYLLLSIFFAYLIIFVSIFTVYMCRGTLIIIYGGEVLFEYQ